MSGAHGGENVETLALRVDAEFRDLRTLMEQRAAMLDERYQTQTTAIGAALAAQQTAMHTAFVAAKEAVHAALVAAEKAVDTRASGQDREFHEHLAQYRHEVGLAFEASARAISKAEAATEKRFESVNEFRAQLTDQATRFMPRAEAIAALERISERIRELTELLATSVTRTELAAYTALDNERIQELANRLNRIEGRGAGLNAGWVYLLGALAALGTIVSVLLAFR